MKRSFLSKFLSVKVFFSLLMVGLSTVLLYIDKITSDNWVNLMNIIIPAMLIANVTQKGIYNIQKDKKGK